MLAGLFRLASHDLQDRIQVLSYPVEQGAGVAAIRPESAQTVFGGLRKLGEHQRGDLAIVDAGGIDHHLDEIA